MGSVGFGSEVVSRESEVFQNMQKPVGGPWAALPLPGWQPGMAILLLTHGHEMCVMDVMFVHFSNDSGDVL